MLDGLDLTVLELLSTTFSLAFSFWPVLLVGMLLERGRNMGRVARWAWGSLAAMRLFLFFFPSVRFPSLLIREPLNTALFLAAGVVLFALQYGIRFWEHRTRRNKTGSIDTEIDLGKLPLRELEEMVAELYRAFGHRAKRTGSTGDHGVDVVVQAKNGEKWVIQCKHWHGSVGEPVVRDFYDVLHHEKADSGAIITTGRFTAQARDWVRGKPLYLYDGEEFLEAWKRARAQGKRGAPG